VVKRHPDLQTAGRRGRFDAPTTTEWSAFWAIPRPAKAFNGVAVGLAAAVSLRAAAGITAGEAATLAVLAVAGMVNVELGRLAEGGRVEHQRIHKGLSAWPFATALLLAPGLAGWVAAAVYLHAGVRGIRIRRWKWIGSWAIVTLAATAAAATLGVLGGGPLPAAGSLGALGAATGALAVFLAVEAALFLAISRLNTPADEVYLRAQLATAGFYLVELAVLASGVLAAVLYRYWPGFLLLAGPAALLMQRGMLHQPLQHEARHDAKTGVLNSEAWRTAAVAALAQARRERRPAAVLLVDVDHFKGVNDT
jgi:hypothetical protein